MNYLIQKKHNYCHDNQCDEKTGNEAKLAARWNIMLQNLGKKISSHPLFKTTLMSCWSFSNLPPALSISLSMSSVNLEKAVSKKEILTFQTENAASILHQCSCPYRQFGVRIDGGCQDSRLALSSSTMRGKDKKESLTSKNNEEETESHKHNYEG